MSLPQCSTAGGSGEELTALKDQLKQHIQADDRANDWRLAVPQDLVNFQNARASTSEMPCNDLADLTVSLEASRAVGRGTEDPRESLGEMLRHQLRLAQAEEAPANPMPQDIGDFTKHQRNRKSIGRSGSDGLDVLCSSLSQTVNRLNAQAVLGGDGDLQGLQQQLTEELKGGESMTHRHSDSQHIGDLLKKRRDSFSLAKRGKSSRLSASLHGFLLQENFCGSDGHDGSDGSDGSDTDAASSIGYDGHETDPLTPQRVLKATLNLDFDDNSTVPNAMPSVRAKRISQHPRSRWSGGKEEKTPPVVFYTAWWTLYLFNLAAFILCVFVVPWEDNGVWWPGPMLGTLLLVLMPITTILIADIATDFLCIALAMMFRGDNLIQEVQAAPMTPCRESKYLVVYCLKSGEPSDILETLGFLQASWSINSNYSNAQYCILSGTDKPALIAAERDAIASWNKDHAEGGQRVRYVRRCRKVLFKYGQYLDLIMLMNGHKECMLYKDQKSSHPSGDAFDPEDPDVDYFCGSDFELIVLMDRDNCLSENFFNIANGFFEAHPDVQILQPAITPYPAQFRRGLSGETYYTSLSAKFQALGNDLAKYKRVFIPSAAFYGKGIIRRSTYNETLLGYNPQTGSTDEEDNIPRDLLSHDIIESSVMRAMLAPEIAVYEDFAQTHVEWALRQQRWDLGDLIISKYLFPHSFGLLPNIMSRFSFAWVVKFYQEYFQKNAAAIYSSTYNVRCILIKPVVLLFMATTVFARSPLSGLLVLAVFVNIQIVVIPLTISFIAVRSVSKKMILLLQIHTMYMGVCDIYFGAYRMLKASHKIITQNNRWNTFRALGNSPFMASVTFVMNHQLELGVGLLFLGLALWGKWGKINSADATLLLFFGLIITFPLYTFITAHNAEGPSDMLDESFGKEGFASDLNRNLFDALKEVLELELQLGEGQEKAADKLSGGRRPPALLSPFIPPATPAMTPVHTPSNHAFVKVE